MKIQILGPGCTRCETLAENTRAALREMALEGEVEKVTELAEIARMGVFTTPALAVDGVVKVSGRLLSVRQVKNLLEEITAGG